VRVCSLLPSATETVFALGMGRLLVGVTHECDYPPEAAAIPQVTRTNIAPDLASREIDAAVSSTLGSTGSLYELDRERLEQLQPDLILSQRLCHVCAVSADRVEDWVERLQPQPRVLNLEPHSLADILANVGTVAEAMGCPAAGQALVEGLRGRIDAVAEKTRAISSRPRVLCLEWVDPPYCGGHWMKELVEIAGGLDELAQAGEPSRRIPWDQVLEFSPEVVLLACCGFPLPRCVKEAEILAGFPRARELPASRAGRVYAVDASSYFSRPGPRIVDSLEILAHCLHPELFPPPPWEGAFCRIELKADRSSKLQS